MSFLKDLFKPKNPNSRRFRLAMARHLDRRALKCVSRKGEDGVEEVIGRDGVILVKGDEIHVICGMDTLLAARIVELSAWELLSLEGVVMTAPNRMAGGEETTLIAYYKYWRKLDNG